MSIGDVIGLFNQPFIHSTLLRAFSTPSKQARAPNWILSHIVCSLSLVSYLISTHHSCLDFGTITIIITTTGTSSLVIALFINKSTKKSWRKKLIEKKYEIFLFQLVYLESPWIEVQAINYTQFQLHFFIIFSLLHFYAFCLNTIL